MDIFKLVGSVFIDTTDSDKALQKTGETAEKTGSKFGDMAKTAGKVALGVGAAVGTAGAAMIKSAKDTAANMDVVDKASQRMKVSAESYQELAYAANLSGVEMSTLEKAAKKLEGTDLNMDQALEQIYALGTAEERSAMAAELFGETVAYQMTPMLNASAEDMASMRKEANDLGLVMGEDVVKAGATMNDTFSKVEQSFGAVANQIGAAVMPIVSELLNWVLAHMPEIQATINTVFAFIQEMIPVVMDVIKAVEPIVSALFAHIKTLWETILKPVLNAVISLLKGDFKSAFSSVFEAIGGVVRMVFSGMISAVKAPLNTIIGLVNGFINGINRLKIPDWVPGVGGRGINIPNVPYLAKGGSVIGGGSAIVGEEGAELIEMPQGARVTPLNDNNNAFAKMERQLELLQQGMNNLASAMYGYRPQIVLDTGVLVGEIAPEMDEELGNIAQMKERGV